MTLSLTLVFYQPSYNTSSFGEMNANDASSHFNDENSQGSYL